MTSASGTRYLLALLLTSGFFLNEGSCFDEPTPIDLEKDRELHKPLPEEDDEDPDDPTQPPDDGDTCEIIDCGDDGLPDELDGVDGIGRDGGLDLDGDRGSQIPEI